MNKTKIQLEPIYLMNVMIYIPTYREISHIIQINKKCFEVVSNLKITPNFTGSESTVSFLKRFSPTTVDYKDIISHFDEKDEKSEFIRNPSFHFTEDQKERIIAIFPKIQHMGFSCIEESEFEQLAIENAEYLTSLQLLKGDLKYITLFFEKYTKNGEELYVPLPKLIRIFYDNQQPIIINSVFLDHLEQLLKYIRPNDFMKIVIQCTEQVIDTPENRELMKRINSFKNVYYTHIYFRLDGINQFTDCYLNSDPSFSIAENIGNDSFNQMIEKCASDTVYCGLRRNTPFNILPMTPIWNLPECVKSLNLHYLNYVTDIQISHCLMPIDMSSITKLTLYICNRFCFTEGLNALQEIVISSCTNICFAQLEKHMSFGPKKIENISNSTQQNDDTNLTENNSNDTIQDISKQPFLSNIKSIFFYSSDKITFVFDTTRLERIEMAFCRGVEIKPLQSENIITSSSELQEEKCQRETPNFKRLFIRGSERINLPAMTFDQKKIFIEECEKISFNSVNPVKYLGVKQDFFIEKMKEQIVLPDIQLSESEKDIFRMRRFHTSSEYVNLDGNILTKAKEIEKRMEISLWSRNFYTAYQSNQTKYIQVVQKNEPMILLPDIIHYFELKLTGLNVVSIGVADLDKYKFGNHHIGWYKGSIGYHSDDGQVYNENGYGEPFGEPYGLSEYENHVVGCGYDSRKKEVFYTRDGIKNNRTFKMNVRTLFAGFAVSDLNKVEINYGDTPFEFDLVKEYENNGYNTIIEKDEYINGNEITSINEILNYDDDDKSKNDKTKNDNKKDNCIIV